MWPATGGGAGARAGLLTRSTFNITDWIVQGVTIDSDTAHWKGASLHILFFAPSVSASPAFAPAFSDQSRCNRFLPVSRVSVKWRSCPRRWPRLFLRVNHVSAADHPAFPLCQCHDPTVANLKSALDFFSFKENSAEGFPGYLNINDSGAFNCQWRPGPWHNRPRTASSL